MSSSAAPPQRMTPTADVIVNATAGTSGDALSRDSLAAVFRDAGLDARVRVTSDGAEALREARAAVEERDGDTTLVAGGGDGTIGALAALVAGTQRRFGVLPLGTFNHFAKDLGLPLALDEAARVAAGGRTIVVDVGEVNGRVFVNNSSIGLYPRIVRRRRKEQERLGRGKWTAFLFAAFAVFRRYPFLTVRLSADGRTLIRKTPFVFVGNNVYEMEGLQIGARQRLDAGVLSLYVTHRTGRFGLLLLAVRALAGRLREAKDFDALTAKEIWIETRRPRRMRVATDGEVTIMRTPLHYRIRPRALRVIVPRD
ncbi:MAG TPA: diacylglycerol kinase family protein [Pyrinomonadaceae bacterium]|nr:diacylglycerol kinase family protein [Pyrinomonadaceae bacterium]